MKADISQPSRKRRLLLLIKGVLIPLVILMLIVYFGLSKFSYLFTTEQNIKNDSYISTNNTGENVEDIEVENVEKPIVKEEVPETPVEIKKPVTQKPIANTNWWEYPKNIKTTTRSGNDYLVLVNKSYKLPSSYSPKDLVSVKSSGIRTKGNSTYYVRDDLISSLTDLVVDSKKDGIDISILSAYRSYSQQVNTYNYWVKYNKGCVSCADKISARPGHSQHQLGTAVDFGTKENGDVVGDSFTNTKAELWLRSNAWKYGFVISYPKDYEKTTGYSYESWHYRFIGIDNAKEMRNSGMILENWLQGKN